MTILAQLVSFCRAAEDFLTSVTLRNSRKRRKHPTRRLVYLLLDDEPSQPKGGLLERLTQSHHELIRTQKRRITVDGRRIGRAANHSVAPVSWKEFGVDQQREADENRSSTISRGNVDRFYLPVKGKFVVSTAFACAWVFLSWNLAQPWLSEFANDIGYAPAVVIIFFIALFPGFLNAHIISSVILDRPPELRFDIEYPPINLLVAAYNEAQEIAETIRGIKGQDYPGRIDIIVVDDGSTDNTISILNSFDLPNLKIIRANHGGKAKALNQGLNHVSHDISRLYRRGYVPSAGSAEANCRSLFDRSARARRRLLDAFSLKILAIHS